MGGGGDGVDMDEKVAMAGAEAFKALKNATVDMPSLSQRAAIGMVIAAKDKADNTDSGLLKDKDGKFKKTRMFIRIVGADGSLLASTGAEDARKGRDDIAGGKAKTATLFTH